MSEGQVTIRGLVLGDGTPYPFVGGGPDWWNKPGIRTSDVPYPRNPGTLFQKDLDEGYTFTMEVAILGTSREHFQHLRDRLVKAWATSSEDTTLEFTWGGRRMVREGRTRRASIPSTFVGTHNTSVAVLQFEASDPRFFDEEMKLVSTGVGEVTGGLGFPHGFPHGFGSATPGLAVVLNEGNTSTPAIIYLVGPLVSPRVDLLGHNLGLSFDGLNLRSEEAVAINTQTREVIHLSASGLQSSGFGLLTRRKWFSLSEGYSQLQLTSAGGTGTMMVLWRDAWI